MRSRHSNFQDELNYFAVFSQEKKKYVRFQGEKQKSITFVP